MGSNLFFFFFFFEGFKSYMVVVILLDFVMKSEVLRFIFLEWLICLFHEIWYHCLKFFFERNWRIFHWLDELNHRIENCGNLLRLLKKIEYALGLIIDKKLLMSMEAIFSHSMWFVNTIAGAFCKHSWGKNPRCTQSCSWYHSHLNFYVQIIE